MNVGHAIQVVLPVLFGRFGGCHHKNVAKFQHSLRGGEIDARPFLALLRRVRVTIWAICTLLAPGLWLRLGLAVRKLTSAILPAAIALDERKAYAVPGRRAAGLVLVWFA